MSRVALIDKTGLVTNIVIPGNDAWKASQEALGLTVFELKDEPVSPGDTYDGKVFIPKPIIAREEIIDKPGVKISPFERKVIAVSSDSLDSNNRTFALENGDSEGQLVTLFWDGLNAGKMPASKNMALTATWTPNSRDTLTLVWLKRLGVWAELSRSQNT